MNIQHPKKHAFTLIELILVITILTILMGLLFASLRAVRRYSREVSTRVELANLEAAFRQYYDHYGQWPIETYEETGDTQITIDETIINILSGKPDITLNPDQIPFFEIARVNSQKEAVSAWGYGQPYQVKFDTDGDNTLENPLIISDDPNNPQYIHRSVIVWIVHPDYENAPSSKKHIIGSWQQ